MRHTSHFLAEGFAGKHLQIYAPGMDAELNILVEVSWHCIASSHGDQRESGKLHETMSYCIVGPFLVKLSFNGTCQYQNRRYLRFSKLALIAKQT